MGDAYCENGSPGKSATGLPGQVVLVMQGGGALGAYQGGVYQAMHEAGIEPDWVIGTSIGAINGAIIAGNSFADRLAHLHEFWRRIERKGTWFGLPLPSLAGNMSTMLAGLPGFFAPSFAGGWGLQARVGVERAAFYNTESLATTLKGLVDIEAVNACKPRLTVGAVNVRSGTMHYFDSRQMPLSLDHVLASGALPPAFPAVRIDGDPYWDGGIYSNTPVEMVFAENPRHDSVVFTVQMWHASGAEPDSIWQVFSRQKDIQYASRADSHIAHQRHLHHMRHIVRELVKLLPDHEQESPKVKELVGYGCGTTMHIIRLTAPRLDGEDHMRDIDFSQAGIETRWQAGYDATRRMLRRQPWTLTVDPMIGVAVHDEDAADR